MRTGGTQVELIVHTDEGPVVREPNATVHGTGTESVSRLLIDAVSVEPHETGTTVQAGGRTIEVRRLVELDDDSSTDVALMGVWTGQPNPVVLARVS